MAQFKSYRLSQPKSSNSCAPSAPGRICALPEDAWTLKTQSLAPSGKEGVCQWGTEKVIAFPSQDDEAATGLRQHYAWELKGDMMPAPSLRAVVLALDRKSYNPHTTEPRDQRRTHACLGDAPNLPESVWVMVLSGISSPLRHKPEVSTDVLGAWDSRMGTTTKVGTLLLKLRYNMHSGLSLDIKQLFHKYCLWWTQLLHYPPQTVHLLLFCFKHTLWQGIKEKE